MAKIENIREILSVNDTINIIIKAGIEPIIAHCDVVSIKSRNVALVTMPKISGVDCDIEIGQKYNLDMLFENGDKTVFNGVFKEKFENNGELNYELLIYDDIKIKLVRKYSRFFISDNININIFSKSGDNVYKMGKGMIKNISYGGIAAEIDYEIKEASEAKLSFVLEGERFDLDAMIVRYEERKSLNGKNEIGLKFINMNINDERRLFKTVDELQAKIIKKD